MNKYTREVVEVKQYERYSGDAILGVNGYFREGIPIKVDLGYIVSGEHRSDIRYYEYTRKVLKKPFLWFWEREVVEYDRTEVLCTGYVYKLSTGGWFYTKDPIPEWRTK